MFKKLKIRRQYKALVAKVEEMKVFDGRGRGVDVYVCEKCGRRTMTRYKDKGVTPFVMRCSHCDGYAQHVETVSEDRAVLLRLAEGVAIQNWVRPPLKWLLKQSEGTIDHVLQGGLVLEKEVWYDTPHIYD